MRLDYGRGPCTRSVDRRAASQRQVVDRTGVGGAVRIAALRRRPSRLGARDADAGDGVRFADDGRAWGARRAGPVAGLVREPLAAPFPAAARGLAGAAARAR